MSLTRLDGGPGLMDMYDMKPDAPAEYGGNRRPVRTIIPGFDITELYPMRERARRAIPVAGLPFAECFDALNVYREWPGVPVSALPHAGAVGITAFQDATSEQQCSPHARVDVETWTEIDAV